jgi:septal ring factor EnvC (AmiA/AmiB activator)
MTRHARRKWEEMPPYTVARTSAPQKPPALSKDDAVRLWFANRQLNQTNKAVVQSKERHKASCSAATRRCSELESRLLEIERRATEAERRVAQLTQELAKCEKQVNMRDANVAPHILRQKVIGLIRRFHPDRNTSTTPTEVTKALNLLVEEIDTFSRDVRINS